MATSCEFDFMEYINEESIDSNLVCGICHKPYKDPICTPCDHTYGRGCITHWLTQSVNYSCPLCQKQPLLLNQLTSARGPLRNMLDQLRVRCTLCDQTDLQRGNFVDHINKFCPKAIVACQASDIKCPWKGPRDELHNHVPTCLFEQLRPVLASLMAENQRLTDQVEKHDNKIKKLIEQMSQLGNTTINDSGDESDSSLISEFSVDGSNQKEENAIFIQNLPATVKFNDIFDFFSKVGRIKYNPNSQKVDLFIFKNPINKDGLCHAKVVYMDKESANAAVAEYNGKNIPQWNTRLRVQISRPRRKNPNESGKTNKNENANVHHKGKTMEGSKTASNQEEKISTITNQPQSPTEKDQATVNKIIRRGPRRPQGDKSTA